ncbi:MAG TPA: adenine deaminase C-terminal domain-containing protein, partial [Chitinophagaceae bacterium]
VADKGKSLIETQKVSSINRFDCNRKAPGDLGIQYNYETTVPAIEALDGQLITNKVMVAPVVVEGKIVADPSHDLLKIIVVNRYHDAPVAKALIRHFGIRSGAIASSVAHDSHNIVAVGTSDEFLARAINLVIDARGGISFVNDDDEDMLSLPVGGLMSDLDGYGIAEKYAALDRMAKNAGSQLSAPFMTLSFMALLVIPYLKLSDLGLFDGERFRLM